MTEKKFYPLSSVTKGIQKILAPHMGKNFWVKAEISSGRERGGSFYCDLVETDQNGKIMAQMRCSIWSRDLSNIRRQFKECDLDLKLDNGTSVGFQCSLQYHPQYGLSLKVIGADPAFALGELELKKKEILDRLTKEGLLNPNKELPVSMIPQKIGLISSKGSAAYNDVLKTLNSSSFGFKIYLADTTVQGNKTEKSVIKALDVLERLDVELVIIVRGGGSKTDLFYLDNEAIARRIASYKIPVWTGIGHETDFSILDHVANRYFKTPTAVAEEIIARFVELNRHVEEAKERFKSTWMYRLEMEKRWLQEAKTGIRQGTRKLLDTTKTELRNMAGTLRSNVLDRLGDEKTSLSLYKKNLSTAPLNTVFLFRERLQNKRQRYGNSLSRFLVDKRKELENKKKRFHPDRFNNRIRQEQVLLETWKSQFKRKSTAEVNAEAQSLDYMKGRFRLEKILSQIGNERRLIENKLATIRAVDPKTSLKRGFSLLYKEDGVLIKSVAQVELGGVVITDLSDGKISSTVNSIKEKRNE